MSIHILSVEVNNKKKCILLKKSIDKHIDVWQNTVTMKNQTSQIRAARQSKHHPLCLFPPLSGCPTLYRNKNYRCDMLVSGVSGRMGRIAGLDGMQVVEANTKRHIKVPVIRGAGGVNQPSVVFNYRNTQSSTVATNTQDLHPRWLTSRTTPADRVGASFRASRGYAYPLGRSADALGCCSTHRSKQTDCKAERSMDCGSGIGRERFMVYNLNGGRLRQRIAVVAHGMNNLISTVYFPAPSVGLSSRGQGQG